MADKNPFASVGLSQFGAEGGSGGIGQDILAGLTAYGIDKSGLKDYLNTKGISKNEKGQWGYAAPVTSTMPVAPIAPVVPVAPPNQMNRGIAPIQQQTPAVPSAIPDQNQISTQPLPYMKPNDIGHKILDDDFHGSDSGQGPQEVFGNSSVNQYVPGMNNSQQGSSDIMKLVQMFAMG
jgi:hypothetical protein